MQLLELLNEKWIDPYKLSASYSDSAPFPHIVMDEFLSRSAFALLQNNKVDLHNAFGRTEALEYFSALTSKERKLLADPYALSTDGFESLEQAPVHTDFSKHLTFDLDRRLNLVLFIDSIPESGRFGLELYGDKGPVFVEAKSNRCLIFDTTDFSPHSVVLEPSKGESVRAVSIFFYSCGRPETEVFEFVAPLLGDDDGRLPTIKDSAKKLIKQLVPPILLGRNARSSIRITGRD